MNTAVNHTENNWCLVTYTHQSVIERGTYTHTHTHTHTHIYTHTHTHAHTHAHTQTHKHTLTHTHTHTHTNTHTHKYTHTHKHKHLRIGTQEEVGRNLPKFQVPSCFLILNQRHFNFLNVS